MRTCAECQRAPDMLEARVDRMGTRRRVRVADLRPIEADGLATVRKRPPDDHPLIRIAVLEVRVGEGAGKLIEPPCRIRSIVASIAAIAVDYLRPGVLAILWIVVGPRAVVLRAAGDLSRVRWVDRHINELQRVEIRVD